MTKYIIRTAKAGDAAAIANIHNQGIAERASTFETTPRRLEDVIDRIADTRYPLLVVVDETDSILGWAGLSNYRPRDCYAGICDFSIYLERGARGRGIGKPLLDALIETARERKFWKLVSRIFSFNAASRALCAACGFREVGIYEKHGQLDGQWLDVVIVERLITENLICPTHQIL